MSKICSQCCYTSDEYFKICPEYEKKCGFLIMDNLLFSLSIPLYLFQPKALLGKFRSSPAFPLPIFAQGLDPPAV